MKFGNGFKVRLDKEDKPKTKSSRAARARAISKDKNIDEMLDEMSKKESKFRDSIRVDNEDGHIKNSASKALKAQVIEENDPER